MCCKRRVSPNKNTLPNLKTKSSGEAEGSEENQWAAEHLPVYGSGRARMEHEKKKNEGGRGGRRREVKKREEVADVALQVDGRQPAAGGLRELRQDAGQRPVLSLQPLFNLPQRLNLLYLGEVLRGGGGRETGEGGRQNGRMCLMKDRRA